MCFGRWWNDCYAKQWFNVSPPSLTSVSRKSLNMLQSKRDLCWSVNFFLPIYLISTITTNQLNGSVNKMIKFLQKTICLLNSVMAKKWPTRVMIFCGKNILTLLQTQERLQWWLFSWDKFSLLSRIFNLKYN
jgi:hypothetical protein